MEAFHAELREFIRRLDIEDRNLSLMRGQTRAIREGIRNLYADGLGGSNACLTTISGKVIGGDAAATGLASSTLQITGHVSGTNYGTFALPAGTFALSLILNAADTSLDLIATGPGTRFTTGPTANRSISQCGTN